MVGQLFTPTLANCGGGLPAPNTSFPTTVASGNSYTVPSPGVITSWSFQENAVTVGDLKLKVGRTSDGINYTIVGESPAGQQTPSSVNTYPTRIAVQADDRIGVFETGGGCASDGNINDKFVYNQSDVPPGATAVFIGDQALKFPVAAFVEHDADRDGFGDETQDKCPTDGGGPGPCFKLGKVKRNRHRGTATLTVSVPGPGSLALRGTGLVKQPAAGRRAARSDAKAVTTGGEVKLKLRAKGRKAQKLDRTGSVRIKARVTYIPSGGGHPETKTKRIRLIERS